MTRSVNVLLVDDDVVDQEAIRRAFTRLEITHPLVIARDGEEALEILRHPQAGSSRPYLIVLDLKMPRMSGMEFLHELRSDPHLQRHVVFVLTTSSADADKCRAYSTNVAGYLEKSNLGAGLEHLVPLLDHYWRSVVFPPE